MQFDSDALNQFRLATSTVVLRVAQASDLPRLARLAGQGICAGAELPAGHAWYGLEPRELEAVFLDQHQQMLDGLGAPGATVPFVVAPVTHPDWAVGMQYLHGDSKTDVLATSSWLAFGYSERGYDRDMRGAALFMAFRDFKASAVTSAVYDRDPKAGALAAEFKYQSVGTRIATIGAAMRQFDMCELPARRWSMWAPHVPLRVTGFESLAAAIPLAQVASRDTGGLSAGR